MITSFFKILKNKSGQEGNNVTVDKRSISSPLWVRRIPGPYAELGLHSLVRRALNRVIMKVNTMGINIMGINMLLPYFSVIRYSIRRRAYMQSIIAFVSLQWHAHNWHKTMLGREQGYELGVKWVKQYWLVPRRWDPGDILSCLSLLAPRSGPNRSIAFRVMDLMNSNYDNSLELMLSISYYLGVIAFWEMAPQIILEVDPTLVLQPEKVLILSKVILHHGFQPLDVLDVSLCTDNTVHNHIADDFQLRSMGLTEEARAMARAKALAIAMSAALMGIMLNAVATSNITI